ncbi:hypothetical protein Hanom_Chr15g01390241 [Helianthus anomalus]
MMKGKILLYAWMRLRGITIIGLIRRREPLISMRLCSIFPPAEIKSQEEQSHERTYHSYLEETASSTSTTHRIVREWRCMHKEWDAFEASKKEVVEEKEKVAVLRAKLEADQAKFESEQKTEEWSSM